MSLNAEGVVGVIGALFLVAACGEGAGTSMDTDAETEVGSEGSEPETAGTEATTGPQSTTAEPEEGTTSTADPTATSGETSDESGDTGETEGEPDANGMVLALTNPDGLNAVIAFTRSPDGLLEPLGQFATGGMGSGGGLGSQSALAIADDYLYVVNPGDDTVSSMRIYDDHVALVDVAATDGVRPTSVAVRGDRLYVLNAEGAGSLAGFELDGGAMTPIAGASRPLSGAQTTAPAQVGISPDGDYVVVTERATNLILTYAIAPDGSLGEPLLNPSSGQTPFGFQFRDDGVFLVSEAFGGGANPGASAASSYRVADGGSLWTFSGSVANGQTAACWIEIVGGRYAYTTNTASNSVSGYHVAADGSLELFLGGGVVHEFGEDHSPIDMARSEDDRFLYVLNGAADEIAAFTVEEDGTLTDLGVPTSVPATTVGLIGF